MKRIITLLPQIVAIGISFTAPTLAEKIPTTRTVTKLRELIVSHTDDKGILQLYRMKEDGSGSQQITNSKRGCQMPSCSPDGKKLLYVERIGHALSICISDIDGKNARVLIDEGVNLIPSWVPDSLHIVFCVLPDS